MSDNLFDKLKNAFEPIGAGLDGGADPGLPKGVVIVGERMRFGDAFTAAKEYDAPVREDGPDACGYLVIVPAGGSYRRADGCWMKGNEEEEKRLWIECVGAVLEVAYVRDGMPCWERYVGIEL